MSRTNSRIESSQPNTDALIYISAYDLMTSFAAATDAVLTRNAAGDWAYNQIASKTNIYAIPFGQILARLGLAPDVQEQFGTALGVAGPSAVANTGYPGAVEGRPPFTGATHLNPQTGFKAKGMNLLDVVFHYQITTNPLTAHTCRVDKCVYANNVANAITAVLATGANGLATAAQANPYSTKVVVNAGFNVTDQSYLIVEQSVQTPAGGTFRNYGMTVHVSFNYN